MKIGIDISQIVYKGTGVARFLNGLTNYILDYDQSNHWTFFFSSLREKIDPELERKINSRNSELIKWKLPPTLLSFVWNDLHISKIENLKFKIAPDWFITSDWTEPPSNSIRKATIVHDLVYLRYPETVTNKILRTQTKRLKWVAKESQIIFADSETTKKDLIKFLEIKESRIVVNYPGVKIVEPNETETQKILNKYNLHKPFVLTVGKLEPRKNLHRLINAFNDIKTDIDLVIVGPSGWENYDEASQQNPRIRFLGYIPDNVLYSLYSSCVFLIYPSLWEGFGYPIIEAMKLGAPVACSNDSSVQEIAQDGALLFNPLDVQEISHTIKKLISTKKLRQDLTEKGKKAASLFTWERYYQKMIQYLTYGNRD